MMMNYKTLDDYNFCDKKVLVRLDLNVPMQNGDVSDSTRIQRAAPTVIRLVDQGAKVILISHFGRPKGQFVESMSLKPLISELEAALANKPVTFVPYSTGPEVVRVTDQMNRGQIVLLENLRFNKGEESNNPVFALELSKIGDCFVNDAFSVSHRAHASTEAITKLLPSFAGPLMEAEIAALSSALNNPIRPLTAIVGGAKVSTKLDLLMNLVKLVDKLIIGGGMANTFLFARQYSIGKSLAERELADTAREIEKFAKHEGCEIILQTDALVAGELKKGTAYQTLSIENIPKELMILDVGPKSVSMFSKHIQESKTIVWNGPLGAFEFPPFDISTKLVAQYVAKLTQDGELHSIAGGGDTVAALNQAGVIQLFDYVSTAGGAFLEWLEGKELPGVAALQVL